MANQDDIGREPPGPEPRTFNLTTEILENLPEGFAALDREWRYLYVNPAAERLLGKASADLLGKTAWSVLPNLAGSPFERAWRLAMDEHTPGHVEAFDAPLDAWFEEHAYPSPDGIWIFFQNITERKRQQQALEETTAYLERTVAELEAGREEALALMESIPEGFLALDRDWRITSINAVGAHLLGSTREDLLGTIIWEYFPEVVGSPFEEAWRRAMEERTTAHVEEYYPPRDGWFEEHAYPAPEGLWIFFQNVTARRRQREALEETKSRLEHTVAELEAAREREERSRLEVEEGARWSGFLAEMERLLASSLDYRTVLDSLVHAAVPTIADLCGVSELHADDRIYTVAVALRDRSREAALLERLRPYWVDGKADIGLPRVLRTGEAVLNPEITDDVLRDFTRDEAHFQEARTLGFRSGMAIPLTSRQKILGVIWFATTAASGRRYDETDFERARDLVSRAALAADNALLYQDVERAERRSRFLAEAGEVLAASLADYEVTLQSVASLSIPLLADYCVIDLVEDHRARRVAAVHRDPALGPTMDALKRFPPTVGQGPVGEVISSGKVARVPDITPAFREAMAADAEHLALLRRLGARSLMVVPLIARGRILGTIYFAVGPERPPYDADDQALAEELARRAALSVDNARLYQESKAANRAKSDFLAVISHELRTPLNAIIGYTDLLSAGIAGPLTAEQGKQLGRVDASARHLLQLIEEVLTYSRMEVGREELQIRPTDVGELLRALATATAAQAAAKGLVFHLDLPATPLRIQTDPAKVRQIMANLLSNAVKFTERGEITLSARLEEDALRVRVQDTGIGIAPEHFEKLFEPFWQAEPATTRRAGGTGLGLPVSRRLALLLGGDLTVVSARGEGSTFTLHLPLTPPPHPGAPPPAR